MLSKLPTREYIAIVANSDDICTRQIKHNCHTKKHSWNKRFKEIIPQSAIDTFILPESIS